MYFISLVIEVNHSFSRLLTYTTYTRTEEEMIIGAAVAQLVEWLLSYWKAGSIIPACQSVLGQDTKPHIVGIAIKLNICCHFIKIKWPKMYA